MAQKDEQLRIIAAALSRVRKLDLSNCFDPINIDSRPNIKQQEVINEFGKIPAQYLTAGNQSGKSQLCSRLAAWVLEETHPTWKRPKEWGDEKLLLIIMGRTTRQIEDTLWSKVKSFLPESSYKEHRTAGQLTAVTHENGNRIIFLSHHNENEAREKVQSFVAHFAWIDELPGSVTILEELERRVQARRGMFLCSFTPKIKNEEIRKKIDASTAPYAKKYQFSMFDNPIYTEEDKARILDSLKSMSQAYINCVLHGDWLIGESAVYQYNSTTMCEVPEGYSPSWRHVEASDPASSSKFGFTLWAESPNTGIWYCVKAEKIEGFFAPDDWVDEVAKRTAGYNLVRRIADGHEHWYIMAAGKKGLKYVIPFDKNSRKSALIKNFQDALSKGLVKLTPWADDLAEELYEAQWSEAVEGKIINGSKYHLCDSAQYFVDCKPKSEVVPSVQPWHVELRQANEIRKKKEAAVQKQMQMKKQRMRRRWN